MSIAKHVAGLVGWLAVTFAAAAVGAAASLDAREFYGALDQPGWAPPSAVFGPVWTVLYSLMAVAAWLVWRQREGQRHHLVLTLFVAQLVLNALWTWLFFGWSNGVLALVDIGVLWVVVAATAIGFWRAHRLAGVLLVPYLAWVGYAAALNAELLCLNPQVLG